MKRKRKPRCANRLEIERLEDRKLLAADLGLINASIPIDVEPPQQQIATDSDGLDLHNQRSRERGGQRDPRREGNRNHREANLRNLLAIEAREIDGHGNHLEDPTLGSADTALNRATTVAYADGISDPAGTDRPSARQISNEVAAQTTSDTNARNLTDITWLWGQFVDHDIDLSEGGDPAESFDIVVPTGDPYFDPMGTGTEVISFNRSGFDPASGTSLKNPRQQVNQITAFLDGSVVYGSDEIRAAELRTFKGGLLKTNKGDLLPFNEAGLDNAGGTGDTLFLAGDIRANENIALTAMHTLWVREHNAIATRLAADNTSLDDEQIYQAAKAIVTAEIQAITFNEYLPALLGTESLSSYRGYDPTVDPGINNVFSGAAYRFGHSMLSSELLRLNNDGSESKEGNISLQDAFFSPDEISANGIDSLLLGAATQVANEVDNQVVDDIRNFLFGPPGSGGFDLASLNIQRGRDHGLADYNQVRQDFGLKPVTEFSQITSDVQLAKTLEQLYGDVDNIDVWVGGLAQQHVAGSSLGELFSTIIVDQFERIRDGDRLWYQNVFSGRQLNALENTSLADVIERNTNLVGLRNNLFFQVPDGQNQHVAQIVDGAGQHAELGQPVEFRRHDANRVDNHRQRIDPEGRAPIVLVASDMDAKDAGPERTARKTTAQQRRSTRQSETLDNAFTDIDGIETSVSESLNHQIRGGRLKS